MRGKKLSRLLKKNLGSDDAEQIIADFTRLVSQDSQVANNSQQTTAITMLGQFGIFLDAIESAFEQMDKSSEILSRSLEISTQEQTEITSAFKNMLESLGDGILMFNREGICSSLFSSVCLEIYGQAPAGKKVSDLLSIPSAQCNEFLTWIQMMFDETMPLSDLFMIGPKEISMADGTRVVLEFKPVRGSEGKIQSIALVASPDSVTFKNANDDLTFTKKIASLEENIGSLIMTEVALRQHASNHNSEEISNVCNNLSVISRSIQGFLQTLKQSALAPIFENLHRLAVYHGKGVGKELKLNFRCDEVAINRSILVQVEAALCVLIKNLILVVDGENHVINLTASSSGMMVVFDFSVTTDSETSQTIELNKKYFEKSIEVFDQIYAELRFLEPRKKNEAAAFQVILSVDLAVLDGFVFTVGSEQYIVPASSVDECFKIEETQIHQEYGAGQIIVLREQLYTRHDLCTIFAGSENVSNGSLGIVIVSQDVKPFIISVDEISGIKQVLVRRLKSDQLKIPGLVGTAMLEEGRPAFYLDVPLLVSKFSGISSPLPTKKILRLAA